MEVGRQMLAVAAVFLLLGAVLWLLRRASVASRAASRAASLHRWLYSARGARVAPPLERVGRLALTPQHTLHLVRIQGSEIVVATHPQGCSVLSAAAQTNAREARA